MQITNKIQITNEDNMVLMSHYTDNYFDLAIVDPPYGINGGVDNRKAIETKSGNNLRRFARKGGMEWDQSIPPKEYFDEIMRVSKNQIIWGGNYFLDYLGATRCLICWDKMTYIPSMSQMEVAWTSFNSVAKCIPIDHFGAHTRDKVKHHPTQKPVDLYKWLLDKYAKPGDKILDTHLGSGSIAIAAHDYGFELTACELDKDYYDKAIQRTRNHTSQVKLF